MSVASLIRSRLQRTSAPRIVGHVDGKKGIFLFGWVADLDDLAHRLTVDVICDGERIAGALADRFREDLEATVHGDGKHLFACELPEVYCPTTMNVSVQVRETGTLLKMDGAETFPIHLEPPEPFIDFIACDIVNNCNLRCPFCVVDYSLVKTTELMPEETFRKLLSMIYTVPEAGFWMSCLHEPTLNPNLNRFLELIPLDARKKVWFTTNMIRPLDEETLTGWAKSGIHHINVSLDSMNPDLFAVLRKFGRFDVFKKNLDLMTDIFRRYPEAPYLRFISMAFKSNLDEIPELVRYSNDHWLAIENEIRYTYNYAHIPDDFRKEHYLEKDDWPILTEKLSKLPYNYVIVYPPEDYEEDVQNFINFDTLKPAPPPVPARFERPLELRMRPDGTMIVIGHEREFAVNIHSLPDAPKFFRDLWRYGSVNATT